MVAASKVRRAQEQTVAGKPYAEKLRAIVGDLVGKIEGTTHPYLEEREEGKTLLILISSDKGLAGSMNTNLLREFIKFSQNNRNIEVISIGRKLLRGVVRMGGVLVADFPFGTTLPTFEATLPISKLIVDEFKTGEYKKIVCLYMQFISLANQKPVQFQLLPVQKTQKEEGTAVLPYTFEPNPGALLTDLMPHFLEMTLYQILLESYASEQAARMLAMHQASENAKDVITELSLSYNKARQEKITNELLDITGGAMGVAN